MLGELYQRSPNTIFSSVGNDIVALHVDQGRCYGMEHVTARVWELLAEPVSIETICLDLQSRYEVQESVCKSDIEDLMKLLKAENLVSVTPER